MFYKGRLTPIADVEQQARQAMAPLDRVLESAIASGRLKRARRLLQPWRYAEAAAEADWLGPFRRQNSPVTGDNHMLENALIRRPRPIAGTALDAAIAA